MRKSVVLDTAWGQQAHELELSDELYEGNDDDIKVVLEVAPEAYDLIGNYNAEILSSSGANNEIKRIEMNIGYLPSLGKLIAKYGGAAKVISPQAAREVVRDYALKALGRKPLETAKD
jgi:proteasome accessory factor C